MEHSHSSNIQASEQERAATGNNGMDFVVFNAAKDGNIAALRKYLKDHEDLSQILTPTKNTVLHIYIACVEFSRPQLVREMLSRRPLLVLSRAQKEHNATDMLRKMLELCPPLLVLQPNESGDTPLLHIAARYGRAGMVELLIQAAKDGQLLEHDRSAAYVGDKDQKMTALHFAASKGHADVMKELITQCPDCCELVDHKRRNILHCAIDAGNIFLVEDLVLQDPWLSNVLLNGKDDKGDTPLHRLATCNSIQSYSSSLLPTDARVDKMAFNKENRNAVDILVQVNNRRFNSSTIQGNLDS